MTGIWYPDEKLARAKELGYPSYLAAIVGLYNSGKSTTETGKLLGVSGPAVRYRLVQFGIELRSRGGNNRGKKEIANE